MKKDIDKENDNTKEQKNKDEIILIESDEEAEPKDSDYHKYQLKHQKVINQKPY